MRKYEYKERNKYFEYAPKFRKEITDHILLETFDEDIEIYKAIQESDLIAKNKNDIIKLINEGVSPSISVGAFVCILKGIDVKKKKDEIIKEIEKLDDFKWIRISYIRTELSSYDINRFEEYKKNGFPKI